MTKNFITRLNKLSTKRKKDVTHVIQLKLHERMNKKRRIKNPVYEIKNITVLTYN